MSAHDGYCWLCVLAPIVVLAIAIFVLLLQYNNNMISYYTKMTALYMTIMCNAIVCCVVCTPVHFFGDPGKVVFDLFWLCSRWTGIYCKTRNTHLFYTTKQPYIVIANHQSSIDVVVISNLWPPNCTIMMKKSLRWIPFFNYAAYLANTIFVDRFNHAHALRALDECVDKMLNKRLNLFVFPEGTRNSDGALLPFKKGAFNVAIKASIPIIPLVISSYKQFYNKQSHYFANNGYVIAEVMQPISTEGLTLDDVPKLADEVRTKMMETFNRISEEAAVAAAAHHSKDKSD